MLTKHGLLSEELEKIKENLENYDNCDPIAIEKMKSDTQSLITATNRWTDNIYSMVSFCKNKLALEEKQVYEFFGLPEEFDYV